MLRHEEISSYDRVICEYFDTKYVSMRNTVLTKEEIGRVGENLLL